MTALNQTSELFARVYVGTYAKYNNGSIAGKWVDLTDFSDMSELYDHFAEIHSDESDPEYMFQDYEVCGLLESMVDECGIDDNIFEVIEAVESSHMDYEVLEAFAEYRDMSEFSDFQDFVSACEDAYSGEFDSDIAFTQDLLESCGDIPSDLPAYIHIDWESTARDIMMDYHSSNGHYFRCY